MKCLSVSIHHCQIWKGVSFLIYIDTVHQSADHGLNLRTGVLRDIYSLNEFVTFL